MKIEKDISVLIIEKSKENTLIILNEIKSRGYNTNYKIVDTCKSLIESASKDEWNVILGGYNPYGLKLVSAIKAIRQKNTVVPFIVVSDKIGEENVASLIKAGANNYIARSNLLNLVPTIREEIKNSRLKIKQQEAFKKLKESEKAFKSLVENVPDIVYMYRLLYF